MTQWLRHHASKAGGLGSVFDWGTNPTGRGTAKNFFSLKKKKRVTFIGASLVAQ